MKKMKLLPPERLKGSIEVIDQFHDGDYLVTVYAEYTPDMGREATSRGGWGRFSGVGNKHTAGRRDG